MTAPMTAAQKADALASSIVALLILYALWQGFGWWCLLFLPYGVWEVYSLINKEGADTLSEGFVRILKRPLVGAVLAVAAWHFFVIDKATLRAFLAGALLAHFIFQFQDIYRQSWSEKEREKERQKRARLAAQAPSAPPAPGAYKFLRGDRRE